MDTAFEILSKAFLCGVGLGAGVLVVVLAFRAGESAWKRWHTQTPED
jgi:hypothetical protein